jgi:ketosteroid isomerase-like protein
MVRFSSLYRRGAALVWRLLSPRSRLRRALLRRQLVSGWDAGSRKDLALMLVRYAPDAQLDVDPGLQTLVGGAFVGHHGIREGFEELAKDWDWSEAEPAYILDFGERLVNLGFLRTHARASGIQLVREMSQLVTMRDGLVTQDQLFLGWEEGLRAAGLDSDAIAFASRLKAAQAASSAE